MIDQATIDRIISAANIVDVVSEFVTLRKRGVNYVGLCPFHADKSPSFYVSPAKNICKCFACGEGGTAVHFIMKHEQIGYLDALRYLAKKYGIEIQERELTEREKQFRDDRESMFIVNQWAQQYFTKNLFENLDGRMIGLRYFIERGLREETIRKFQLGYALDQRDALAKAAQLAGYQQKYLEKTGLVIPDSDGKRSYDRFRGRVIFPVHSLSGKVVAFGGRVLKKAEKTAKYVNSPESEIYHKSDELYGLFQAKQTIVRKDHCFLVEGYMDVIGMHQAGIENVVASSGTALTRGQIRLIRRFTNNITILYDGDAAGIKAAIRGIDMFLEEEMNVKVVLLPDGEDPDSFARSRSASEFSSFIEGHETDFIRFKTQLLLKEVGDDPVKRAELITDMVRTIAIIPNNISRAVYIRECAAMMTIDEQVLINEVNKIRLGKATSASAAKPTVVKPSVDNGEKENAGEREEASAGGTPGESSDPANTANAAPSPYRPFEIALLRYVVRYGERVLFDYFDEERGEQVTMRVAAYIRFDLERDDLTFYTPQFKQMLDEAADHCDEPGFVAQRYFLAHPDPLVSQAAASLISDKYQLSKYHSKYRELEQEEDKLEVLVPRDIYAFKEAYIVHQIKELQLQIKGAQAKGDMEGVMALMARINKLNGIKGVLCKELGERIVLRM